METKTEYATLPMAAPLEDQIKAYQAMLKLLGIYCPACGETGHVERETEFILSPGAEGITCPTCGQQFLIEVEFLPLDNLPEIGYHDGDARKCVGED